MQLFLEMLFKGVGGVSEKLLALPPLEVALPCIVVYELGRGALKSGSSRRQSQLAAFLEAFTMLPFGPTEASEAARISTRLEAQGHPIGPLDVLIAGTARAHGATLVTRNTREFSRVEGLRLENWYTEAE